MYTPFADLEVFLQQASISMESVLNDNVIFEAMPHALVTWNNQVERTYSELRLIVVNLHHTVSKIDDGK